MDLPIDIIPGSRPPRFRWQQTVPIDGRTVNHQGTLPPTVEEAVAQLIALTKSQQKRLEGALTQIAEMSEKMRITSLESVADSDHAAMSDRIAAQQELERITNPIAPTTSAPEPISSSRKDRGTKK